MVSVEVKRVFFLILVVMAIEEVVPRDVHDRVYTPDEFDALMQTRVRNDVGGGENEGILPEKVVPDNADSELGGDPQMSSRYLINVRCSEGYVKIANTCFKLAEF